MKDTKINITTVTNDVEQKGIFFRSIIQKVTIDFWDTYNQISNYTPSKFVMWCNKKMFKKAAKENWDILILKVPVFPIYFKRNLRTAFHLFENHPTINYIKVSGYEPYMNDCAGAAEKETTWVVFKNGLRKKIITKGNFKYYYKHIIEHKFIDNL